MLSFTEACLVTVLLRYILKIDSSLEDESFSFGPKMDAVRNPRECPVCKMEFNQTGRRPRNLHCSHHLCTSCIDTMLCSGTPYCPFCREYIRGVSAAHFKINYGVEDFMRFEDSAGGKGKGSPEYPMTKRMAMMTKEYRNATEKLAKNCQQREDQLRNRLKTIAPLEDDLNGVVEMVECELRTQLQALLQENKRAMRDLEAESTNIRDQISEWEDKRKDLQGVAEDLMNVKTSKDAATSLAKADACHFEMEELMASRLALPPENKDTLKNVEKILKTRDKLHRILEISNSQDIKGNLIYRNSEFYRKLNLPTVITADFILQMGEDIRFVAEQDLLYAVQRGGGKTWSAKISYHGKYLYLHCLINKRPPFNACTIRYKEMMVMREKSMLTFLEIGSKENTLGRVHVRLSPDNHRAKNFALLCSGTKEVSYVDSKLLETWGKGQTKEHIRGGDYARNTGEGGAPLIPVPIENEKKNDPWRAGSVWGKRAEASAAQFYVSTRDDPGEMIKGLFGRVEEGLGVIKDAIDSYDDIRQLRITDCGFVFQPSRNSPS